MSDFVYLTLPAPWATEADLRDEVERLRAQVEQLTGCLERCREIRRQNTERLTRERDAWKGAHAGAVRALKAMRAELRRVEQQRDAAESHLSPRPRVYLDDAWARRDEVPF